MVSLTSPVVWRIKWDNGLGCWFRHNILLLRAALPLGLASLGSSPRTPQEWAYLILTGPYRDHCWSGNSSLQTECFIFLVGTLWSVLDEKKGTWPKGRVFWSRLHCDPGEGLLSRRCGKKQSNEVKRLIQNMRLFGSIERVPNLESIGLGLCLIWQCVPGPQ